MCVLRLKIVDVDEARVRAYGSGFTHGGDGLTRGDVDGCTFLISAFSEFVLASDHDAEVALLKESLRKTEILLAESQEMVAERDAEIDRLKGKCKVMADCVMAADAALNRPESSGGLLRVVGDWSDAMDEAARLKDSLRKTESLLAASQEMISWRDEEIERLKASRIDCDCQAVGDVVDEIAKRLRR